MNRDIDKQAAIVVKLLSKAGKKTATAESCTGGLVSAALTSVSGSSEVFDMGVCSYANEIKNKLLGVPEEILEKYGAVSEQTAKAMSEGAAKLAGADYAVSTTGIAGPTGGTAEKPVGTVWIGVYSRNEGSRAQMFLFSDKGCPDGITPRDFIREQAVLKALELLTEKIKEN